MKIEVVEKASQTTLFSCPLDEAEKAYQYAVEAEQMGLDVEIKAPSVISTLANGLGANSNDLQLLEKSIEEEIESHEECTENTCSRPFTH